MALPKFFEFFEPFLHALSDGELHTPGEVRDHIANEMNLSEEDMDLYEILKELEEGRTDRFTLRKNGRWYMEGQETSPNSVVLMLHYQAHSIDPSY